MHEDNIQVWDGTWSGREKVKFDLTTRLIFGNIAKGIPFRGKRVLELGCGSGRLSYLAYQAGAEEITLVDFSEEALRIARNLLRECGKATFIKADILELELPERYDIVFSSGVVEHFKDEELPLAIKAHAEHSREYIAVVVPSDTIFNRRRSISPQNIELYGYWKPISTREMKDLFEEANIEIQTNRRFHLMYGVPFPDIPGAGKSRVLLTSCFKPLDHLLGGLLLTIGRVV